MTLPVCHNRFGLCHFPMGKAAVPGRHGFQDGHGWGGPKWAAQGSDIKGFMRPVFASARRSGPVQGRHSPGECPANVRRVPEGACARYWNHMICVISAGGRFEQQRREDAKKKPAKGKFGGKSGFTCQVKGCNAGEMPGITLFSTFASSCLGCSTAESRFIRYQQSSGLFIPLPPFLSTINYLEPHHLVDLLQQLELGIGDH